MKHRLPPSLHPLATVFQRSAESLTTSLKGDRYYRGTARHFLDYLGAQHPRVRLLRQLRRDPHILDWYTCLRSHQPPLAKITHALYVIRLRRMLEELAWTKGIPHLTHLVRSDDIPRRDQYLPRPLTAEQDRLLQQELSRRDDRDSNAFLLLRHTGMRIGECVDLPWDCLRRIGQDGWAIHVPLGKLQTERLVPLDSFACQIVNRLRLLRSQDPLPADGLLLARPRGRDRLIRDLRTSLHKIVAGVGITSRIVPHRLRHSFATEMLRAGVSLPAVTKLLGHKTTTMTMGYLEVSLLDVQREFQLARLHPRHLRPAPKIPTSLNLPKADLSGLLDSLHVTQHILEMFRRSLTDESYRRLLDRLANRLTKIVSEAGRLGHP